MESDYIKLKQIKPVLSGYIREAQSLLKTDGFPDGKVVHDVRVLMKKARAALRLASPQMDVKFVEREIQELREVGRILSSWRDTLYFGKLLNL